MQVYHFPSSGRFGTLLMTSKIFLFYVCKRQNVFYVYVFLAFASKPRNLGYEKYIELYKRIVSLRDNPIFSRNNKYYSEHFCE